MFSYNFMLLFVPAIIECFPVNIEPELKPDLRDETSYPNGTVVGKYSYVDNDGTPVQVKYFADNKNYGVELQSFKVFEGAEQPQHFSKQPKIYYLASDPPSVPPEPAETQENIGFDFPTTFPKPEDKYKVPNLTDLLSIKNTAKNHCKEEKTLDYDFSRNSLMPIKTKKCGKDIVRLYYDKRSRRVRKTVDAYKDEIPKICDQF